MIRRLLPLLAVVTMLMLASPRVYANDTPPVPSYQFAGPSFGLDVAPGGNLFVADSGAGIVELRRTKGSLLAKLPGVADVAATGPNSLYAVTGQGDGPNATRLFRITRSSATGTRVREIANLGAFEAAVNPDGGEIDSNPFHVAVLSWNKVLVADAAGNSLLVADRSGKVDWVATLPKEEVSTENAQKLLGCPNVQGELAFVCKTATLPAEAVVTSVAIGPDGAYYIGELKGFPAPLGKSRVWRIERGTLHAECGKSPACQVVADGFTSITDLEFGRNGTLYVVELDEASWLATESGKGVGGTVNACRRTGGSWNCSALAANLRPNPTAVAIGKGSTIYATLLDFSTFQSQVAVLQ